MCFNTFTKSCSLCVDGEKGMKSKRVYTNCLFWQIMCQPKIKTKLTHLRGAHILNFLAIHQIFILMSEDQLKSVVLSSGKPQKRLTVQDFTAIRAVAVEIFRSSGEPAEWLSGLQCHRWSHNGNMATDKLRKGILEYSYAEQICKCTASTIGEWQTGAFCGQSTTWLRCELWIDMFVSVQWQ